MRQMLRKLRRGVWLFVTISLIIILVVGIGLVWLEKDAIEKARNIVLIAGGFVALVFAFWRSHTAEQEHYHKRFQQAAELLASEGRHARISALHSFRYLVVEAPRMGSVVYEVIMAFIVQLEPKDNNAEGEWDAMELNLALETARVVRETMCEQGEVDAMGVAVMKRDLVSAVKRVTRNRKSGGLSGSDHAPS